ncbi:MAG: sugar-binding protein [Thermoguttaceae bacterium]
MRTNATARKDWYRVQLGMAILCLLPGGAGYGADGGKKALLPAVAYELKTDSKVSVAIYDQQGAIVRQLLMAAPRKAGRNVEEWDGLDDKNKPLPPGQYSWKLLSSQGLKARWITSLGSGLTPGWQIMPGNHVGAVNAAVDDDGNVYVMGGCSECVPGMAKITPDGRPLWYSGDLLEANNDCGCGLAGGKLFTLVGNAKVLALDPATGKGLWKATTDWNDPKNEWGPGSEVLCLAARGDQVVISHKTKGLVRWINPADGSKLDEAPVPGPQALALDGVGNVLVVSGTSVVRLSRTDKAPRTIISGLVAPARLAVDPVGGDVFVAEAGDSRQIKRFAADGKLLAAYGRKGGRLFGKYEPQDFRGVTGITTDRDGGFVVIEGAAAPRRVAFFDTDGKHRCEWHGGVHYANGGAGDPDDPSIAWYHSGSGEVLKAKIDFVGKTYKVLETYKLIGIGNGIIGSGNSMDSFLVRRFNGRTYLVNVNVEPRMVLVDDAQRRLVPVVSSKYFLAHDFANPAYTPRPFIEAYYGGAVPANSKYGDVKDAAKREAVMWTDLNGDGMPQQGEMVFSARKLMTWACGRMWIDDKMNIYEMSEQPMMWRPKGWTRGGAPLYGGWADWQAVGGKPKWFDPLKVSWPAGSGVAPLSDGSLLGFFNSTENPFGKGIGTDGIGGNYIVKWDKSGKPIWCTGFHSPDFGAAPGEGRFFWNIAGLPHDCLVVTDMQCYFIHKNLVYVWDPDGLWVGRLLENPDLKAAPQQAYVLATENFGGTLLEVAPQHKVPGLDVGDVVFYGCGQNVTPVFCITGWETFRRAAGSMSLSPAQAELAKGEAFKAAATKSRAGKLSRVKNYVSATLPRLAVPPVLDGKLDDEAWKKAGVVDDFRVSPAEEDKETLPTTIYTGYDDANLYIAMRCTETTLDKVRTVGSPLHLDDSVELFIGRNSNASYVQIMVNPRGDFFVGFGLTPKPDVKIQVKAGREARAWVAELVIPWKNIEAGVPKPGERVIFNAVRNRFAEGESHSSWSPLRGNLNHSPNLFGALYAGNALPRDAVALREGRAFVRKLGPAPLVLDGSIDKWRNLPALKIMDGTRPVADLYLGWKADGLYAAFDVATEKPWKNAAAFEMAFNGGASCDLQVGPIVKDRKGLVPGDVRFLAAPLDGKAEVVEFLPKLTADLAAADRAPRRFHTDAQGDNLFERLALLKAGCAAAKPRPDGKGYVVEIRVPLRAPLRLQSGERFKLDASVILSNKEGTRAELRLPWHSTSGDDMFVATDVIVETTLRPANWGEAELE